MGVVETDVNRGAASGRDHVAGRVTGVEGSDCQGWKRRSGRCRRPAWLWPAGPPIARVLGPDSWRDADKPNGPCTPVAVKLAVIEPRRPILIISPIRLGQVGSPTIHTVIASPCDAIQSRMATVPSVANPSSSPVIAMIIAPSGGESETKSTAAAANAATPDFMSVDPRPQSWPSRIVPLKGSSVQSAGLPTGTTSGVAV